MDMSPHPWNPKVNFKTVGIMVIVVVQYVITIYCNDCSAVFVWSIPFFRRSVWDEQPIVGLGAGDCWLVEVLTQRQGMGPKMWSWDVLKTAPGSDSYLADWRLVWGFHKWGYPIAGWFTRENTIKIDDLGVPLFQETSNMLHGIVSKMGVHPSCGSLKSEDDEQLERGVPKNWTNSNGCMCKANGF